MSIDTNPTDFLLADTKYAELTNSRLTNIQNESSVRSITNKRVSSTASISSQLANVLSCIIDDAIDQIHILGGGISGNPDISINFKSLEERAKDYYSDDPIFDPETAEPFEVAFNKKKLHKIYDDSAFFKIALVKIRDELKETGTCHAMISLASDVIRMKNEETNLVKEERYNFELMNSLKQQLLTESRDSERKLQALNERIAKYKDETEDLLFENLLRIRYIEDWEKARIEQSSFTCEQKENELENTITKYKTEIEKEIRVNSEIESYIMENQKDMEDNIDYWMKCYDREIESRQTELQILKEKREDLQTDYLALKKEYESHKQQIEEYLEYKDKKRIEEEHIAMLNEKATKIQAWWRGLMVRLQLGPYNPKKGKKGKKGKGKDKKAGKKK